ILIANRGEVAIRIARAAGEMGIDTVAVYAPEDTASLHLRQADRAIALSGRGAAAYLDVEAMIEAALKEGCDAIHPGYGFLSESTDFARRCTEANLTFIGPSAETLALLGDKGRARNLASETGIPLAAGSLGETSLEEARQIMEGFNGRPAMIKALAGGGGRGMRIVEKIPDLEEAFARAGSEAKAAFGSSALYIEELIRPARHVEIQIAGDTDGNVIHLFERECSLQRRQQKLIEFAPAPHLDPALRDQIAAAAVKLASAAKVHTLCTMEFLVDPDESSGRFVFMEANPRLQVEHTVTEEVMGIDLVQTQIRLAKGQSLSSMGLTQESIGRPRGMALQMRVNMERIAADGGALPTGGTLLAFGPPGGAGIRIESFGYAGYQTTSAFDSLLAKVIAFAPSGKLSDALLRGYRSLSEFRIDGIETNLSFLQSLLRLPEVREGRLDTGLVERNAKVIVEAGKEHPRLYCPDNLPDASVEAAHSHDISAPPGTMAAAAQIGGLLVEMLIKEGETVAKGRQVAVIEAMKMEHIVTAEHSGIVRMIPVAEKTTVEPGQSLYFFEPAEFEGMDSEENNRKALDDSTEIAISLARSAKSAVLDAERLDAVARQHKRGSLTARERIDYLCDADSFKEIGSLIRNPALTRPAPADGIVAGSARIDGRPVMVVSQDFTVYGGSAGHLGSEKMLRIIQLAEKNGCPLVMLLDGGGHRIQDGQNSRSYARSRELFATFARMTGWVPIVSAVLGFGFAANTNFSAMADLVLMVRGKSTMGLAGPSLVKAGTGEIIEADDLGGAQRQVDRNGLADLGLDSEEEVLDTMKGFLSYLPSNARCAARILTPDGPGGDQSDLEKIVSANTRKSYDMRQVIKVISDKESVFEIKPGFAKNILTSLARIEGRPVGFIANQPLHLSGMLNADACEKAARFIALCDAYGLPLIYLVDIPGMSIGSPAEDTNLGRRSAKMLFELGHATVPRISIVLRKGYGLGYVAMAGGRSFDADASFIWPTAEICAMSVEGSVDVAYSRLYLNAPDPAARRQELIDEIRAEIDPIKAAEGFGIDELIEPSETRSRIIDVLARAPARRPSRQPPKFRAIAPI
ncbi:MAG: carbamoyl-phosphate synthase large subunit, partial [Alphaproteobacteria bacterium]